jgi:hypothetical protein
VTLKNSTVTIAPCAATLRSALSITMSHNDPPTLAQAAPLPKATLKATAEAFTNSETGMPCHIKLVSVRLVHY